MAITECGWKRCPTKEEPNDRWWVMAVVLAEIRVRPYRGERLMPDEVLLCGEACVTRLVALWMADQQTLRGQRLEQDRVLAEIERQI